MIYRVCRFHRKEKSRASLAQGIVLFLRHSCRRSLLSGLKYVSRSLELVRGWMIELFRIRVGILFDLCSCSILRWGCCLLSISCSCTTIDLFSFMLLSVPGYRGKVVSVCVLCFPFLAVLLWLITILIAITTRRTCPKKYVKEHLKYPHVF